MNLLMLMQNVTIDSVAIADNYSLALDADGVLWGWGDNRNGQLAMDKSIELQSNPRRIVAFEGKKVARVFVGHSNMVAAILRTGKTKANTKVRNVPWDF